jgi:hypothetical protein
MTLFLGGGAIAWDRLSPYQIRTELAELGLKIQRVGDELSIEPDMERISTRCALHAHGG